jgi:hypothetical protein
MKPLNYKKRKNSIFQFILVFGAMILVLFITGFLTLKTGEYGINVLEKRHSQYTEIYKKKAALTYEVEEIIKRLYQINNKDRTSSQHKKYQNLISDIRDKITENIQKEENPDDFMVYNEMVNVIKIIQGNLDTHEEKREKYDYIETQLEQCKDKYIEEQEKKNK